MVEQGSGQSCVRAYRPVGACPCPHICASPFFPWSLEMPHVCPETFVYRGGPLSVCRVWAHSSRRRQCLDEGALWLHTAAYLCLRSITGARGTHRNQVTNKYFFSVSKSFIANLLLYFLMCTLCGLVFSLASV